MAVRGFFGTSSHARGWGMEVCLAARPELAMRSGLPSRLTSPVIRQCSAQDFIIHCAVPSCAGQRVVRTFQPKHGVIGTDKILIPVAIGASIRQLWMQALRGLVRESPGRKSCRVWAFPIRPCDESSGLAIKRGDDVSRFPSRIPIGCNSGIDRTFFTSVTTCFFPFSAWAKVERSGKEITACAW